jgi:hypothetical protein
LLLCETATIWLHSFAIATSWVTFFSLRYNFNYLFTIHMQFDLRFFYRYHDHIFLEPNNLRFQGRITSVAGRQSFRARRTCHVSAARSRAPCTRESWRVADCVCLRKSDVRALRWPILCPQHPPACTIQYTFLYWLNKLWK